MRRTTKIGIGLCSCLIGLCLARLFSYDIHFVLFVPLLILIFYKRLIVLQLTAVVMFGLLLGLWRGTFYMNQLQHYQNISKKNVTIRGEATVDAYYGERSQLSFEVGKVALLKPENEKLLGKISVKGYGEQLIYRGDEVQINGTLYVTRGSKQASISYAKIQKISSDTSTINRLRREFASGLQSALPEPLGSLGLGILIGQRTTLPETLNQQLSNVGLTHIIAVSGYNLTIIVLIVHRLLKKKSKYQATVATLFFIAFFLLLTGSSASVVRASIVSTLSLWAWYYGRTFRPSLLILLSAVITAWWFPPYIWSDIGWYLSFLAFVGILLVAPVYIRRFYGVRQPKFIAQILIETSSAQLLTLPIIMYIFGKVSLISLLANLLVVPLIPLAMMLSFVAGLAGMLVPSIAGWFSWPATIVLTYITDITQLLSRVPYASIVQKINVLQLLALYILIVIVLLIWWKKVPKNASIKELQYKTTL